VSKGDSEGKIVRDRVFGRGRAKFFDEQRKVLGHHKAN